MMRNRFRLAALVIVSAVGAAWGGVPIAEAQNAYTLDEGWPRYPGDMVFEMGTGIAVDGDGVIYTISRDIDHWAAHPLAMSRYKGKGTVARWDSAGRFLGTFGDKQEFIGPHSMYVDARGFIWGRRPGGAPGREAHARRRGGAEAGRIRRVRRR